MVEQQQQTNAQLGHLVTAITQLKQLQEDRQRSIPTSTPSFWKKMALDVPPVVLAVLLAFGINSWWQGLKEQRQADLAVGRLVSEIEGNAATLETNLQRNAERIPKLKASIAVLEANPDDTVGLGGRGIDNIELTEAAWQMVTLSDAFGAIDEDIVLDAALIYNLQLKREIRINDYQGAVWSRDFSFHSSINDFRLNEAFIENLNSIDQQLLRLYREFLAKYDQSA